MAELVTDCPRCNASRVTFDVRSATPIGGWESEAFCVCRNCARSTVFHLAARSIGANATFIDAKGSITDQVGVKGYVSLKDAASVPAPDHVPEELASIFNEGAKCVSVECYNAAGAMFRLCLDIDSRPRLPATDEKGLNRGIRERLALRLKWLFDNAVLPEALRDLSLCIKDDGNDAAHAGTLGKAEAEDLLDFTRIFLERMYTEPERVRLAKERRDERRKPQS